MSTFLTLNIDKTDREESGKHEPVSALPNLSANRNCSPVLTYTQTGFPSPKNNQVEIDKKKRNIKKMESVDVRPALGGLSCFEI